MARGQKYGNETLDALNKGCFDHYDPVACTRISTLILISAVTCFFVILKIVKYHVYRHSQIHHYLIFYASGIECILCIAGSIYGTQHPQLDFTINYLKLLHFVLICHLFWSLAAETRHRDDIIQHVVNPVLCLYTLYLTTVVLMGMVDISGTWTECLRPYWLMLSGADFIVVQLFAMVVLYLMLDSKRSAISVLMLPTIHSQTRELWLITVVFEISAFVSVIFDTSMVLVGREETGCSNVYNHVQVYYSLLIMVVTILKYFLPIWTLLCIFQPSRVRSRPSEVGLTAHYNMVNEMQRNDSRERTHDNQCRRTLFSPTGGLSTTLPYPAIPYSNDSPIYGSFGDFSYTDSLSDISPNIAHRWSMDDNSYGLTDKHILGLEHGKENFDTQYTIDQNRQNYEKTLNMEASDEHSEVTHAHVSGNLTTISEESSNIAEGPHK